MNLGSLAIGLVCVIVTDVLIVATLVALPFDRSGSIQARIARLWARSMLRICRVRVIVSGAEAIDWTEPHIVVANHASLVDIPAIVAHVPAPLSLLAKKELLRVPLLGAYLRRGKHIPVDRRNARGAVRSIKDAARIVVRNRRCVLIFAEGTRSETGVGPFREGAALLAIHSGVPIVPVAIVGSDRILRARSTKLRAGTVEVRFGEPIATAGFAPQDRGYVTESVREQVVALWNGGR